MKNIKSYLEDTFLNKNIKMVIGHVSNNNHITAKCIGFESDGIIGYNFFILLENVQTNSCSLEYLIENGEFNRYYIRLSTLIEIIE